MRSTVWAIATILVAVACRQGNDAAVSDSAIISFDTAHVRLVSQSDTLALIVELAKRPEQREVGLMERRHLPDSAGMLFLYDATEPDSAGFWMYRTRIPLDIAFMDSAGVIRSIRRMLPCETALAQGCPTYAPGAPYRAALEVNAGYFDKHHTKVGDRLLLGDTSTRRSAARP